MLSEEAIYKRLKQLNDKAERGDEFSQIIRDIIFVLLGKETIAEVVEEVAEITEVIKEEISEVLEEEPVESTVEDSVLEESVLEESVLEESVVEESVAEESVVEEVKEVVEVVKEVKKKKKKKKCDNPAPTATEDQIKAQIAEIINKSIQKGELKIVGKRNKLLGRKGKLDTANMRIQLDF